MWARDLSWIVVVGVGLGGGTAGLAILEPPPVNRVRVGPWTGWPAAGTAHPDPYIRAYLARRPSLPLGQGEGIEFSAVRDDEGEPLQGRCRYAITGTMPSAGAWTLTLTDRDGRPLNTVAERQGFTDAEILRGEPARGEETSFTIVISAQAAAGNWLPMPISGKFQLRLRLYDLGVAGPGWDLRAGLLPRIQRMGCP